MRTTPKKLRITSLISVFGLGVPLLIASACGTDAPGPGTLTGGTTGTTGGTTGTTGGTVGNGGSTTTTGGISTTTGGTVGTTGGTTGTTGGTTGTTGGTTGTTGGTVGTTGGGGTTGTTGGTVGTTGGGGQTGTTGGTTGGGGQTGTTGGTTGGGGAGGKGGGTSTGGTTGGTGTGGSTGGSGGGGDPLEVAKALDGKMLTGPCLQATGEAEVCLTNKAGTACNPKNLPTTDPLAGVLTTDTTVTLGGDSNKTYSITLHIQGEVEAKEYNGGTDQKTGEAVSSKMDGFHIGGTPTGSNNYNVYMIRVASPAQDYFLNDLIGNAVSDHTTYLIDYTAKITAKGGSSIRLVAADSNCSMIKNCGPQKTGTTCKQPLIIESPDPKAKSLNPSFDFSKAYDGQWVVMVVTGVQEM